MGGPRWRCSPASLLGVYDTEDNVYGESEFTGAGVVYATGGDGMWFTPAKPMSVTWTYEVF